MTLPPTVDLAAATAHVDTRNSTIVPTIVTAASGASFAITGSGEPGRTFSQATSMVGIIVAAMRLSKCRERAR